MALAPLENSYTVSARIFASLLFFYSWALVIALHAAYVTFVEGANRLPSVKHGRKPSHFPEGLQAIIVLEPSELFSYDTAVSVYAIEDGFEQLVGLGVVTTIQSDGLIQVGLLGVLPGHEGVVEKIVSSDSKFLKDLRVKPSIPKGARKYLGDVVKIE